MARRSHHEEHENHERWLVSYADFITLLFAFFVVMYSISSVNEGQYRVLSNSIVSAFQKPQSSLDPIQVGELVRSPMVMPRSILDISEEPKEIVFPLKLPFHSVDDIELATGSIDVEKDLADELVVQENTDEGKIDDPSFTEKSLNEAEQEIDGIARNVEQKVHELIEDDIINIKRNKFWLEVEIKSSLLFSSGSSGLITDSVPVLTQLSDIFAELPNRINVEGFTDNKSIRNQIFPSNWELSAARAAAVVRLFERNGVEPSRMASIGYGEHKPIAENETEEGRAKNRRVVLVVMASLPGRQNDRIYEFELEKPNELN